MYSRHYPESPGIEFLQDYLLELLSSLLMCSLRSLRKETPRRYVSARCKNCFAAAISLTYFSFTCSVVFIAIMLLPTAPDFCLLSVAKSGTGITVAISIMRKIVVAILLIIFPPFIIDRIDRHDPSARISSKVIIP